LWPIGGARKGGAGVLDGKKLMLEGVLYLMNEWTPI